MRIAGFVQVGLHLLAGEKTGGFLLRERIEWMAAFLRFEDGAAQCKPVLRNIRLSRFDSSLFIGEEPIVGPLVLALLQLGDEVPVKPREERVEKMRAGVGFVAFRQSHAVLFPCSASEIV